MRQILSATVGGLRFFLRGNGVRDGWHFTYFRGHEVMSKEDVVGLSNFEDYDKLLRVIYIGGGFIFLFSPLPGEDSHFD